MPRVQSLVRQLRSHKSSHKPSIKKKKKKERERETESYFDLVLTLSRDPTEVREGTLCIAGEWAESVLGRWTSKSLRQVCAQCI